MAQVRRTAQHELGIPTTIEMGNEMWKPSFMEDDTAAKWGLF